MKKFNSTPGFPGRQRGNDLNRKLKGETTVKKIPPLLLLAILLTGCQTDTYTRKHFPERIARIHTIALLPRVHTAMLNTYRGFDTSPMPLPEEPQIRSELIASTVAQLQRRGFVVIEGSFPGGTNLTWNGPMIQPVILKWSAMAARPDARVLATNLNVDGLIFLDAIAYKSTPHRQNVTTPQNLIAVVAAICGTDAFVPWQQALAQTTLVDGKTGEVLWTTCEHHYFGNFEENKPAKVIEALFARYPEQKP